MIVAWLQTCSSTGTACSGSSPWKVANWRAGPQQIAFAVLSTGPLVLGHRGDLPERRLSVAEQSDTDRLHASGRIVEPDVTVGSSMLIALQAGVG